MLDPHLLTFSIISACYHSIYYSQSLASVGESQSFIFVTPVLRMETCCMVGALQMPSNFGPRNEEERQELHECKERSLWGQGRH